jgi:ABC-type nitrate/sulfonate/bicarbonate transport system permease component
VPRTEIGSPQEEVSSAEAMPTSGSSRTRRAVANARRRGVTIGLPIAVVLGLLVAWELASRSGWQPDYILPAPTTVAEELWQGRDGYWDNTMVTLTEMALGFALGTILGLTLGAIIGLTPAIRRSVYPIIVASQSLPTLALAPLLVLWFGFGILPKVILVTQIVLFPVAVATIAGLSAVSQEALIFGRSLGASPWKLFSKVRAPASLPYIFSGLRISASYTAVAAAISEWAGSEEGLGALMLRANNNFETEAVFGAVVLVTILGVGSFALVALAERLFVPWHERYRSGSM